MKKIMDKLPLPNWYTEVNVTDKKYTKDSGYGTHRYTSINAQYQNRLATKYLGLYGDGWGVRNLVFEIIHDALQKPILLTLDAEFFYILGEKNERCFPISSEINFYDSKNKLNKDLRKKLLTDVTTKALSKIGFNADIFLGMYDDQKYLDSLPDADPIIRTPITKGLINQMKTLIKNTKSKKDIYAVRTKLESFQVEEKTLKEINKLCDDKEILL